MKRWAARLGLGLLVGAAFAGAGCAQERDPISRVQTNALNKKFFVGELNTHDDDPEFLWRSYVVDGSRSQSLLGIGEWGHVDRIRWEITENMLIGRKAYQIADSGDNKGIPMSEWAKRKGEKGFVKDPNGTIVAAYRIQSHFDIRREYNPTTGEEINVVGENTSDRPWQEREFMRVDWSENLVINPMQPFFNGHVFGDMSVSPVSFYESDPSKDDAVHLDEKDGYFDVTNKYSINPAESPSPFLDLQGTVPTCLLVGIYTGSSTYECDAQEAIVRNSYLKIDPNHDFEPLENTRAPMDVVGNPGGIGDSFSVGIVSAGRFGWDPQYGYTDKLSHRFAYIHNTWKRSHVDVSCDSNADQNSDGTADQCEAVIGKAIPFSSPARTVQNKGSQCDVYMSKCTVPYRDREVKTIGYWMNKEAPDELQDGWDGKRFTDEDDPTKEAVLEDEETDMNPAGTPGALAKVRLPKHRGSLEDLTTSWNQLMRVAVATAREVECRKTHDGNRADCHSDFFVVSDPNNPNNPADKEPVSYGSWLVHKVKDKTPVIVSCHNPVRPYDKVETCGEVGSKARVGDIRKNFMFYWPYDSRAPWGGIANWNGDPVTGEIHGAAAQVMGRSATYAAAMQRDIIQIAIGDLQINDIIQGVPAERYGHLLQNGLNAPTSGIPAAEQARRIANIDATAVKAQLGIKPTNLSRDQQLWSNLRAQAKSTVDPRMQSTAQLEFEALASKLRGTQYEAQLVDPSWAMSTLGTSPKAAVDSGTLSFASPLRSHDAGALRAFQDVATERLRAKGVCYMANEAPVSGSQYMASLAGYFKAKYRDLSAADRAKAMYNELWKEAVKGITLHEVGHSLGMLHQFASSWDAPNYNPQYWQLRTNEGKAATLCNGTPRSGATDTCMGPRYDDPETPDELGLAEESRPAIAYFGNTSTMEYQLERGGETVGLGTYDQHTMKALYGRVLETFDEKDMPLSRQQAFKFKMFSQLIERDLIADGGVDFAHYTKAASMMQVFNPKRDCRPATEDEKRFGKWRVVHGQVCSPAPKDHAPWKDFQDEALAGAGSDKTAYVSVKDNWEGGATKTRVRWFYRWGTTHNSYWHTSDSDAGADAYEVTLHTTRAFQNSYPWQYFRRQNREYYYRTVPSRTSDRYFDRMRAFHWLVASGLGRLDNVTDLSDDNKMKPEVMAQAEMWNMLSGAVLMPEPGGYAEATNRQPAGLGKLIFDTNDNGSGAGDFTIGIVDGRFIGEDFNNELGGSWDYLTFINHAGFAQEKVAAIEAIVDGRPSLFTISRDNYLDGRAVKMNFRTDMAPAVDRLVGGLLANDWESVAPHVVGTDKNPGPVALDLTAADGVATRPAGARVLFPNVGYKQQLGTVIFSALFSKLNTDMTLINKTRIWIDGQVGQVNLAPSETIKFTDPTQGYTYVARLYGTEKIDGRDVEKGIGSRMLKHANDLMLAAHQPAHYVYVADVNNPPAYATLVPQICWTSSPSDPRNFAGAPTAPYNEGNICYANSMPVDPAKPFGANWGQPQFVKVRGARVEKRVFNSALKPTEQDKDGDGFWDATTGGQFVAELQKYVGVLDSVREIEHKLGYGPYSFDGE